MMQGLNSNYYAVKRVFKFIIPLNAFINIWCIEAGSMWGIIRSIQCTEAGIEWLRDERKAMVCFKILSVQTSSYLCEISQIVKMLAIEYKNS
jgi:hypothetical protein